MIKRTLLSFNTLKYPKISVLSLNYIVRGSHLWLNTLKSFEIVEMKLGLQK